MRRILILLLLGAGLSAEAFGQAAVSQPRREEKDKAQQKVEKAQQKQAQHAAAIDLRGETAFKEKDLRTAVKEQITTIDNYGLSAPRADDVAFFLALFYRKHGYAKVNVRYTIEGERLRPDINEGPLFTLGEINFVGNEHEPTDRLFDYVVGPTRERYSKLQKRLPFVSTDVQEGIDLAQRFYIAEGYLQANIAPPEFHYHDDAAIVDVAVKITENGQYFFGDVSFT